MGTASVSQPPESKLTNASVWLKPVGPLGPRLGGRLRVFDSHHPLPDCTLVSGPHPLSFAPSDGRSSLLSLPACRLSHHALGRWFGPRSLILSLLSSWVHYPPQAHVHLSEVRPE